MYPADVSASKIEHTGGLALPAADSEALIAERLGSVSPKTHGATLERRRAALSGGDTLYTVLRAAPGARFDLTVDSRFKDTGVILDRLLVSFVESAEHWTRKLGSSFARTPEEHFRYGGLENGVGFYFNHYGWNAGEGFIKNGLLTVLPDDSLLPRGSEFLCLTDSGWCARRMILKPGEYYPDVRIGFSIPLIVRDGRAVPIGRLLDLPRFAADPRNGLNFAPGGVAPEFFTEFRRGPMMLITAKVYRELFAGGTGSWSGGTKLTSERFEILRRTMTDRIREYLNVDFDPESNRTTLTVHKPLPKQSIPAIVPGILGDGTFGCLAVDGRQPGRSAGATFTELQQLALAEGMVQAGFGPAGNDVVFTVQDQSGFWYASSPSGGSSRPMPGILTVHPAK